MPKEIVPRIQRKWEEWKLLTAYRRLDRATQLRMLQFVKDVSQDVAVSDR